MKKAMFRRDARADPCRLDKTTDKLNPVAGNKLEEMLFTPGVSSQHLREAIEPVAPIEIFEKVSSGFSDLKYFRTPINAPKRSPRKSARSKLKELKIDY